MTEQLNVNIIGYVQSPYKEKFAIPRQPGLVKSAKGFIELTGDFNQADMVKSLSQFSHIWVIFVFHETMMHGWKPLVRPPRLGGNQKVGVLATRSTFRPNPIGMSVIKLDDVLFENNTVTLAISGFDLLDATPILDIKPYIPYADAINHANGGYAEEKPEITKTVIFSDSAQKTCMSTNPTEQLSTLITEVLSQDPRPAYKQNKPDTKTYGIKLYQYNIIWRVNNNDNIEVLEITKEVD